MKYESYRKCAINNLILQYFYINDELALFIPSFVFLFVLIPVWFFFILEFFSLCRKLKIHSLVYLYTILLYCAHTP